MGLRKRGDSRTNSSPHAHQDAWVEDYVTVAPDNAGYDVKYGILRHLYDQPEHELQPPDCL